MLLRCTIAYTSPDGQVFSAGEQYDLDIEQAAWLLAAAEGQFVIVDDGADDELKGPPSDRAVKGPPAGGAARGRTRAASDTVAVEAGGLVPTGRRR